MQRPTPDALLGRIFDIVVVGGGITGAATARDAALRGMDVLLVEKEDFAAGTSSRSSKLVHGGLRYLETFQFAMVAESLREREILLRTAPHLTKSLPFIYLVYESTCDSLNLLRLGLTFYDGVSGAWRNRHHKILTPEQVLELEPAVRREGLLGGALYYDGAADDARLTLDVIQDAAEHGATVINHARVVGLLRQEGRIVGVRIADQLSDEFWTVGARLVLNATGPWTGTLRTLEAGDAAPGVKPAKGVHITLRKRDFPLNSHALFLRSPRDQRVVWPVPSLEPDLVFIGTTDTDYEGSPDHVVPDVQDIDYLLEVANHTIPSANVGREHIVGSWAGLRPLVAPVAGTSTDKTSREHRIDVGPGGVLHISGGKLTTSRKMAQQFVDAAIKQLRQRGYTKPLTPCRTARAALPGGDVSGAGALLASATAAGVPLEIAQGWVRRHGSKAAQILTLWARDPQNEVVVGVRGLTRAELVYMVEHEAVHSLQDLLIRRTSLFIWDADGGLSATIVEALGDLLGWSDERRARETQEYQRLLAAHRFADAPRSKAV